MINPFKKTFTPKEHEIFVFLTNIKLFSELNYKQLAQFIPHMHTRNYEKNEVVFFRNDPSHALYLLKTGEVSINIDVNDSFESLDKLKGRNSLGESCLLKNSKRLFNAIVTSETAEFYVIPQGNIFTIFDDNVKIKAKMFESLAEIYNDYNASLFKAYRSSMGFFNLKQVYKKG